MHRVHVNPWQMFQKLPKGHPSAVCEQSEALKQSSKHVSNRKKPAQIMKPHALALLFHPKHAFCGKAGRESNLSHRTHKNTIQKSMQNRIETMHHVKSTRRWDSSHSLIPQCWASSRHPRKTFQSVVPASSIHVG